ncbi:Peptidylprolyl isomerase [Quillaja saponaria]|uniref:peptidylprolyl isomerase n=1 Tax=Quillaja saponaria TaxID=32244 RepID=A0AAD7PPN0_QUISA|nr:Peptidylprolyl isomerase [Quillaja saponaria]
MQYEKLKHVMSKNLQDRFPTIVIKKYPRRLLLEFLGFKPILYYTFPVLAVPVPETTEPEVIRTLKLSSGVRIQADRCLKCIFLKGKDQKPAKEIWLKLIMYAGGQMDILFIALWTNSVEKAQPVILPLDDNQIIQGLKEVLTGMRVGGKRRALIPPSVGYVNENLQPVPEEFGPRRSLFSHANEPLVFEVQLLKVL